MQKKIEELEKSLSEEHKKLEAAVNDRQKTEAELNSYKEETKKQVNFIRYISYLARIISINSRNQADMLDSGQAYVYNVNNKTAEVQ